MQLFTNGITGKTFRILLELSVEAVKRIVHYHEKGHIDSLITLAGKGLDNERTLGASHSTFLDLVPAWPS